jgi:hypothetical protein
LEKLWRTSTKIGFSVKKNYNNVVGKNSAFKIPRGRITLKHREFLFAGFAFFAIFWFQWLPSLTPTRTMPGDAGDNRFNLLMLEHAFQALQGNASLFNPTFFFPFKFVGGFSDLFVGSLPAYAIPRFLGLGMFISMQFWVLVGLLLNYFTCYFVTRKLQLAHLPAIVASLVFTFGLPSFSQQGHLQLLWRFGIPISTYYLIRILEKITLYRFVLFVGIIAHTFLCNVYTGAFNVIWLSALAVFIRSTKKETLKMNFAEERRNPFLLLLSLTSTFLFVYVYWFYWITQRTFDIERPISEMLYFSPRATSWYSSYTSLLWAPISRLIPQNDGYWENQLFIGIGSTLLLLFFLKKLFEGKATTFEKLLSKATIALIFAVTVSGHISLFMITHFIPGLSAMRVPGRIMLVLLFPVGILIAAGLSAIPKEKFQIVLVLLIFASDLVFTNSYQSTVAQWNERPQLLISKNIRVVEEFPKAVLIFLPKEGEEWNSKNALDGMFVSSILGKQTLNGYSGFTPIWAPTPANCEGVYNWLNANRASLTMKSRVNNNLFEKQILSMNESSVCLIDLPNNKIIFKRNY